MGAPWVHAESSAKEFGGKPEDYLEIHEFMDSSKEAFSDLRHRALTHNMWFVLNVVERIFGAVVENSSMQKVPVRNICQQHIQEDFNGGLPTVQDYLNGIPFAKWMDNGRDGERPPSMEQVTKFEESLNEEDSGEEEDVDSDFAPETEHFPPLGPAGGGRGCGGVPGTYD